MFSLRVRVRLQLRAGIYSRAIFYSTYSRFHCCYYIADIEEAPLGNSIVDERKFRHKTFHFLLSRCYLRVTYVAVRKLLIFYNLDSVMLTGSSQTTQRSCLDF